MILFTIAVLMYCIGEGITEGMTWKAADTNYRPRPFIYHIFRFVFETIGIIGMILLFDWFVWWYFVGVLAMGLALYEMSFSGIRYDNIFYNKRSKWFGIPHPPGFWWVWVFTAGLVLFTIAVNIGA